MTLKFDFTDYLKLTKPNDNQIKEWKDYMGGNTYATGHGLRIVMEATHSGLLNENKRFYIPSRMAEGVSTFRTGEKPTKLLKHHNPEADPVGVIRGARFVPTVPDELHNNPDVINLMSSSAPIKDQVKSIRNLWRKGVFQQDDWKGLGHIELVGDVFDKETIEQIRDGRFDAVSTNFRSPGAAHCLICGQNWAADGFCDHEWGEAYEDDSEDGFKFPALAIPGRHKYLETSFVSMEGDKLASVRIMDEVNSDNNKTIFLPDSWREDKTTNSTETTFEFKDFKEDDMGKTAEKETITLSDAEKNVFAIVKELRDDADNKVITEYAKKISALYNDDNVLPDQLEAELDEKTAVQYALEDLETADEKVDADAVYAEMEKELDELELSDKKLSSQARTGLPKSVFCGPDRSFPVPDCAHVTAAKRLVGRYKGPGNKTNILACVSQKAKSLGCDGSDGKTSDGKENPPKVELLPCAEDSLKTMKDDELRHIHLAAELELVDRGQKMAFECKECQLHEAKVQKAADKMAEAQKETEKLKDTLVILREELQRSYADYASQVDSYVELGASLRAEKVDKLALIGVLNKKYDSLDTAKEEMKDKSLDKLELAITDGFDLDTVTTKLNDGMTQDPSGETVEDPTVNTDNDGGGIPSGLSTPALTAIDSIKLLIQDGKISDAKHIYATMINCKLFPNDLMFDSLSVDEDTTE